jgi:hypothetical protein
MHKTYLALPRWNLQAIAATLRLKLSSKLNLIVPDVIVRN